MRSESPEKRGQQKVAEPPSYRIENEYNPEAIPQYFQISVDVLEGRNFTWINPRSANSYVVLMLGKKKYRTSIRRNKQEPHYKEHFTFGMYASVYELQRCTLSLTVMEPRCCAPPHLLGEANIDLGAVWRQPYYQAFRKWVQLSIPREPTAGSMGFLKVDVSITGRGGIRVIPQVSRDNVIEVNYLISSGSEQQQHANFIVTIHAAFGLPNRSRHQSHCDKPPSTFVRVQFCGLYAKTAVQNLTHNPVYSEQVSMVEIFPSTNPMLRFDICSTDTYSSSRLLATTFINLDHISYDGENGFLPTFGPSLLSMYASTSTGNCTSIQDCPFYRGSLLITLNTIVPYYQQSIRTISVEPLVPICMENLWTLKNLRIFCPIFEVSMLDSRLVSDLCGVAITIGEMPTENITDEDFACVMNEVKTRKLHYTGSLDVQRTKSEFGCLDFFNTYPILQATTRLPDYRFRMYRNNFIYKIMCALKSALVGVESRLKNSDYRTAQDLLDELNTILDTVANNILQFSDMYENCEQCNETQLDKKQHILQIEEMKRIREKVLQNLTLKKTKSSSQGNNVRSKYGDAATRRDVKCLLSEAHSLARQLEKLIFKATEGWPDLIIWLLNDGSRIGYHKIPIADIMYSKIPEECGKSCGRIKTIYFKPLKCSKHVSSLSMGCFCVVGKVEFLAWMGLHEQSSSFELCLPAGYKIKMKDEMCVKCNGIVIECRIFIYKACLLYNNICDNLGHVFLRVNTLNVTQDTKTEAQSFTPVWNQMLRIQKTMFTSAERLVEYPPVVLVEVNTTDLMGKTELIGRFEMDSHVDNGTTSHDSVPKFQWYEMYKGMEKTGKVLMSVQILQIPETFLKSTIYTPLKETFTETEMNKDAGNSYSNLEPFPFNLMPRTSTYKLDIYWWGLRNVNTTKKPYITLEIEDLALKSQVIRDKKSNCNFPNGRVSHIFEASFSDDFYPSINMKLYDNCTFGRTLHLGTSTVKKPNKFFIDWYPKIERETLLKCASITSNDFIKVSQTLCVKRNNSIDGSDERRCNSALNTSSTNIRMKRSIWRRIIRRKERDEEEFTLLPTFTKTSENNIKKSTVVEKRDWWTRYIHSQKNYTEGESSNAGETFIIYDTELEAQMQFSKFKDWCSIVKLYNGEKTGIAEKDEELQCGLLKAGIAIYKWPSTENIVAVSTNGVDLNRGFFDDHPSNEPAKFLVRVYVIKGINLKTKKFPGNFQPYVMISCGNIQLSGRNSAVPNTCNPVFGRVYEIRCDLPEEYQLTISLYNHDTIEPDELIGSTAIDLENRIYSKHRARVGLASEYKLCDPGIWRDCKKPSAILKELCAKNHLTPASFPSISTVMVNGVEYRNNDQGKVVASALECRENISLSILRNWDSFPVCGYPLVPEHVETRTLYHPELPGIEQGKLHMWIDIFPIESGIHIPPPVDIAPRKTEEYELKLTIFNVKLFKCDLNNNLSKASNLYVRAWIGFMDYVQNTNCRSVSADGYYNFNWCMIFRLYYDFAERKFVREDRNHIKDFEDKVSPELIVQLLDTESLTLEEPIGWLVLNLNEMPLGGQHPERPLNIAHAKKIDMFSLNSIRAWWLLKTHIDDLDKNSVGCIEIQVTLLPKQKVTKMPVGLDRDLPTSSINTRLPTRSPKGNFSFKNFFYKYNALWGSLTGISVIILIIVVFVYIILF